MCYSTRVIRKAKELELHYQAKLLFGDMPEDQELIYNHAHGFAHPNMWIMPQKRKGHLLPAKWGIMPKDSYGADYKKYFKDNWKARHGLNLRGDDIFDNYYYGSIATSKRCIIPVDGFFEPHTTSTKIKGKPFKVPFYFKRKDNKIMNLAGLYSVTQDKMVTFAIFTHQATPMFEAIHNEPANKKGDYRRPVVLDDDEAVYWLRDDHNRDDIMDIINNDLPDYEFDAWPISTDLKKRNGEGDRPDIIDKVEYEEIEIDY